MRRTGLISAFVGCMVATSFPYVTFLLVGILSEGKKNSVFVPVGICLPTPCASLPKSLTKLLTETSLSVPHERTRYSIDIPVSFLTTEFMRRSVSCVVLMSSVLSICAAAAAYWGANRSVYCVVLMSSVLSICAGVAAYWGANEDMLE